MTSDPALPRPRPGDVDALNQRAHNLRHEDTRLALGLADDARAMALRLDYQHGIAQSIYNISLCRFILGDQEDVLEPANQALSLFLGLGDERGAGNAYNLIGTIHSRRSRYADALAAFDRSLEVRRRAGDQAGEAGTLNNIALVYWDAAQFPEALEALLASLEISEAIGDQLTSAYALNNIGRLLAELGDTSHAIEYFERSLALVSESNDRALESSVRMGLGRALTKRGEPELALVQLQHSLELSQQTGNLHDQGLSWLALGIARQSGQTALAESALMNALEILRQTRNPAGEAETLRALGNTQLLKGDPKEAIVWLEQALEIATEHGLDQQVGKIHRLLSEAQEQQGNATRALEHFRAFHQSQQRAMGMETQQRIRRLLTRTEVQQARREADAARRQTGQLVEALTEAQANEEAQHSLLEQLTSQAEMLKQLAREDGLTGIANRRWLDLQLAQEFERARRFRHPLTAILLDLDDFKSINDTCSHLVGDEVLRQVARLLRDNARSLDVVGRYGGDEFLILLVETDLADGLTVCENLREALLQRDWAGLHPAMPPVTMSIGVAELNEEDADPQALLARADALLYQAKKDGKNQIADEPKTYN